MNVENVLRVWRVAEEQCIECTLLLSGSFAFFVHFAAFAVQTLTLLPHTSYFSSIPASTFNS
jgi:hypothetical protein